MRWKVWLPLGGVALVIAFVVSVLRRPAPPALPPERLPVPSSDSPYSTTRSDARYIGIAECKECHRGHHASYLHTAHSRAFQKADPKTEPPDGGFDHGPSGRSYRVYRAGDQFRHEETLRTPEGKLIGRLDLPVRYVVGSGHFGRSYAVERDGTLFQSPITYYAPRKRWDLSPGYDRPVHYSFERALSVECLVCHVGRVEPKGVSEDVAISEQTIGCENCHGPGSHHASYQRNTRHPAGADDLTIVNPAKLSRPLLEAVCASCHLQAEISVNVRGRSITDFRPGLPLADFRIHYLLGAEKEEMTVVGHLEQMRRSACYQKSDSMSCLTCHDLHRREKPADSTAYYRQKCLNCHASRGCTLGPADRLKQSPSDDCSACHMPKGKTDIPHVAFTHHRVGRHLPSPSRPEGGAIPDLVAVDDNPRLAETDRNRNLGLAYLKASALTNDKARAVSYHGRARTALRAIHEAGLADGETLDGLSIIAQREQSSAEAKSFAREALAAIDLPVDLHGRLMVFLAEGHLLDHETDEAIAILEKLTKYRHRSEDWRILGACYLESNQNRKALAAFEKALSLYPFEPQTHAGLAEVHRRLGDLRRASEHAEKADWLVRNRKS